MSKALTALYDGKVLIPDEPPDLTPNTRVRLRIELLPHQGSSGSEKKKGFLDTARSLELEGPPDWSANLRDCSQGGRTSEVFRPISNGVDNDAKR